MRSNRSWPARRTTYQTLRGRVHRTQTKIGCQHLPDYLGCKPDVWFGTSNLDVPSGLGKFETLQCLIMSLQRLVGEPSSYFAYRLPFFRVRVVACEQESAVNCRTLSLSIVSAYDHKVKGIPNPNKIVLLELPGRSAAPRFLVETAPLTFSQFTERLLGS